MNETKPSTKERELQSGSRSSGEAHQFTFELIHHNVKALTGSRTTSAGFGDVSDLPDKIFAAVVAASQS